MTMASASESASKRIASKNLGGYEKSSLPREKMKRVACANDLSLLDDSDLIAILLRTGGLGEDCEVVKTSRRIRNLHKSIAEFQQHATIASFMELLKRNGLEGCGVGEVKIMSLIAAFELGRRAVDEYKNLLQEIESHKITSGGDVANLIRYEAKGLQQEKIWLCLLDHRARLIHAPQVVSMGSMDRTNLDVREVFRIALQEGAKAIILAHNHLTSNVSPSNEDMALTHTINETSKVVGVRLLDHIIVSSVHDCEDFYSFNEQGVL